MIELPNELQKIEKELKERRITGDEASNGVFLIRRKLGPPWHWKSWKVARAKVLDTQCKTCGAGAEAILYVQHTFKNPRVQPYLDAADIKFKAMEPEVDWRPGLKREMYQIRDAAVPEMRNCCPSCKSLSIQYRKGSNSWICNSKSKMEYCGHIFKTPAKKVALTAAQKKEIRRDKYKAYRQVVLSREHDVKREAMLNWFKDMRRYLSLKDTKTLCKRCAFIEDMLGSSGQK